MANATCSGEFSTPSMIFLSIFNSLSGFVTVCGNFLVLVVIFRTPLLRVASNIFIASLAAADFTIGITMNPIYTVIVVLNIMDHEHPLNIAEEYLWIHTVITTTFNLAAMSVERYIAVIHPLYYAQVITTRRCLIVVAFIWSFSVLFVCTRAFIHKPGETETLWIVHSVIGIAIPLCVITFCYFHIFKAIKQQRRRIDQQRTAACAFEQNLYPQNHAKAARTMAVVILFFILFWTPNIVITVLNLFAKDHCAEIQIIQIWVWCASVAFASSAVNPFVYSIKMRNFRTAIKRICFPGSRKRISQTGITQRDSDQEKSVNLKSYFDKNKQANTELT